MENLHTNALVSSYGFTMTVEEVAMVLKTDTAGVEALVAEKKLQAVPLVNGISVVTSSLANLLDGNVPEPLDNQRKQSYTTTNSITEEGDLSMVQNVYISFNNKEQQFQTQLYYGIIAGKKTMKGGQRFATREEAEAYKAEILGKAQPVAKSRGTKAGQSGTSHTLNEVKVNGRTPIAVYLDCFVGSLKSPCSNTIREYFDTARRICKFLPDENIAIADVTPDMLSNLMVAIRDKPFCQQVIDKTRVMIRRIFKDANYYGLIPRDTSMKLERFNTAIPSTEVEIFEPEEIREIVKSCKVKDPVLLAFIMIAMETGARPSEIRALKMCDILRKTNEVFINKAASKEYEGQTLKYGGKRTEIMRPTKNHDTRRLKINQAVIDAIDACREWMAQDSRYKKQIAEGNPYVFPSPRGGWLRERVIYDRWNALVKANGWDAEGQFNLYRFRHTFCTEVCEVLPLDVARRLTGHMNTKTLDVKYNHIKDKRRAEANKKVINVFAEMREDRPSP
jgi:integrase